MFKAAVLQCCIASQPVWKTASRKSNVMYKGSLLCPPFFFPNLYAHAGWLPQGPDPQGSTYNGIGHHLRPGIALPALQPVHLEPALLLPAAPTGR